MIKDPTRDYITAAFRLYASLGCPTYEQLRADIYADKLKRCELLNPEIAVKQAELAVTEQEPMLLDVLAVERTLELLSRGEKQQVAAAVKAVYFPDPTLPLRRGDISARVSNFSLTFPAEERTVYRWLKEARLLCAAVRGLRISEQDAAMYRIVI